MSFHESLFYSMSFSSHWLIGPLEIRMKFSVSKFLAYSMYMCTFMLTLIMLQHLVSLPTLLWESFIQHCSMYPWSWNILLTMMYCMHKVFPSRRLLFYELCIVYLDNVIPHHSYPWVRLHYVKEFVKLYRNIHFSKYVIAPLIDHPFLWLNY